MIPPHVWMIEFGNRPHREEEAAYFHANNGVKLDLDRLMTVEMPFIRRCDNRRTFLQWLEEHKNFPPPRHSPTMLLNTNAEGNNWRNGYLEDNREDWGVRSPSCNRPFTPPRIDGYLRDDSSNDSYNSAGSGCTKGAKRGYGLPHHLDIADFRGTLVRYQAASYPNGQDPNFGKRPYVGNAYQRGRVRKFGNRVQPMMYHQVGFTAPDRFLNHDHLVHVSESPDPQDLLPDDTLSRSIWDFFMSNQQAVQTYKQKISLWKELFIFLRSSFPKWRLFLVGSTMTGLGSNTSDMDMCLLVPTADMDQRHEALYLLRNLSQYLNHCEFINNVELIHAKVPILKLKSRGLEIDLNCNNSVGIRNTHLLYCYAQADWRVRPLVLIVKLWAAHHHINDAKNMTVSSYSWALMVIHYLQCGTNPPVLPCLQNLFHNKFKADSDINHLDLHEELYLPRSQNRDSLGTLLMGFLKYFDEFNYARDAMSVRLARRVPIEECRQARSIKNDAHQWKFLCIEEPFDLTNTARSVYDFWAFDRVRRIIRLSHERLEAVGKLESLFDGEFRPL